MSFRRFAEVLRLELRHTLTRPMLWTLVGVMVFLAWGMSGGNVQIGTGSAFVGGKRSWITSEFTNAFILSVVTSSFYTFFVAFSSGLSLIRDGERKVGEILHSTRLTATEYAWGKATAHILAFGVVMALQAVAMIFWNHFWPNPSADEIRGPLELSNYFKPALLFGLPNIVFVAGVAFFLGERWRRPAPVYLFPMAYQMVLFSFLWNWSPTWLDSGINRLLMALDPTGFRWLNETWLKLDRGADFYNLEPVGLDALFLGNRLATLGIGLGLIALAAAHAAKVARGAAGAKPRKAKKRRAALTERPADSPSRLGTPRAAVGFLTSVREFARTDVGALLREPTVYIFTVFVLTQTLSNALIQLGAFQTPILLTSGQFAAGSFNTLSLLICLVMMFFLVESVGREETTGALPLVYSSPAKSASLLLGKAVGISTLALAILAMSYLAAAVTMLIQGRVSPTPIPFLLVWGLLLFPTFLAWSSFILAVRAVSGSRYLTYGVGIGAVGYTLYRQFTGTMNWVGNWLVWDGFLWSDMSVLELDRRALVLSRLFALALAAFFFAVALAAFERRKRDATRMVHGLSPRSAFKTLGRLAPYAAAPVVLGLMLWVGVLHGNDGEAAENDNKDYWKANRETWYEAPQPSRVEVDLAVSLEPEEGSFHTRGTYRLLNHHDEPLDQIALTGGRHWTGHRWWQLSAEGIEQPQEPEDRANLFVFTLDEPLAPGDSVTLGFEFGGNFPNGISKNGGAMGQFILPSGVQINDFAPHFVPVVGYQPGIGVDEDNQTDGKAYRPGRHQEQLEPAFGSPLPFTSRIEVTVPEEFRVNAVGSRVSEEVTDGRRTSLWVSDHPVRFMNLVAGRWAVKEGNGTAIYYHPDHDYNIDAMSVALDGARRYFSEWFHPYPWQELKLSEFPALAGYAQGHPTNITFSEGLGFLAREDPRVNVVLLVTAHEAAHQWWGNLLTPGDGPGGNLLSEAMAHYSTILLIDQLEGTEQRIEFTKRLEEWYGDRRFADAERPLVQIDGTRRGDQTLTYDKGGWAFWMLHQHLGREAMLAGLQQFIVERKDGPDYPLIEDLLESLRPYAADPEAYDAFVDQWFFNVVVPELVLADATVEEQGGSWRSRVTVTNRGTGSMPFELAALLGERFDDEGETSPEYRDQRTIVDLGAGESKVVELVTSFEPDRLAVDPDAKVLQLRRKTAVARL